MATLERSIEIDAPATAAYNTWTRFDLFPEFMEGVEDVRELGENQLRWRARIGGKPEEWVAVITEQIPDKRVAWRSDAGAVNAGCVTFHRFSNETSRVMLQMEYEPERISEKIGDALGILSHRVEQDLESFKEFVESRGRDIVGRREKISPDSPERQRPRAD